jgi:hypothetical protein
MPSLKEKLPLPEKRSEMVDACAQLLDREVSSKGGLGGLAVKAAYKVFKSFKPGAARDAVDGLFDDFVDALEPFHQEYEQEHPTGTFGAHLKSRTGRVAEALVQVTDRRAERSRHKNLVKAYQKLRGSAVRNVEAAVPGLADLMDGYYQKG